MKEISIHTVGFSCQILPSLCFLCSAPVIKGMSVSLPTPVYKAPRLQMKAIKLCSWCRGIYGLKACSTALCQHPQHPNSHKEPIKANGEQKGETPQFPIPSFGFLHILTAFLLLVFFFGKTQSFVLQIGCAKKNQKKKKREVGEFLQKSPYLLLRQPNFDAAIPICCRALITAEQKSASLVMLSSAALQTPCVSKG